MFAGLILALSSPLLPLRASSSSSSSSSLAAAVAQIASQQPEQQQSKNSISTPLWCNNSRRSIRLHSSLCIRAFEEPISLLNNNSHKVPRWVVPTLHHHHHHHHYHEHHGDDHFVTSPSHQQQQDRNQSSSSSPCPSRLGDVVFHHDDDALLQTLCKQEQLDSALDVLSRMDTSPSTNTYLSLLMACNKKKALAQAKRVHAHLTLHSSQLTGFLGDYLVMTLARCGAIEEASEISATLPHLTVFSWTAMISAYADCGHGQEALKMHQCMQKDNVEPNSYTFVSLFKACGSIPELEQGKMLHADACRKGFASDIFVGSALLSMYGKCGAIMEAEDVFCALPHRDIVACTAMLSAYVENGHVEKALRMYRQMQEEGMSPNQHTILFALQACGTLLEKKEALCVKDGLTRIMSLEFGQALHADARMKHLSSDIIIGTALLSMYCKCGTIEQAEGVFGSLLQHDIVTWNAMLSAYVEHGQQEKALCLYRQMQEECMSPNQLTFVIALHACGMLAEKETCVVKDQLAKVVALKIGQALHIDVHRDGYVSDMIVGNSLVNMYGKCGAVMEAENVFSALSDRDVVSWNVMLFTYVEQNQAEKALWLYKQMEKHGATLDDVTFIVTLQACSATGTLEICKQLHFDSVTAGYDRFPSIAATLIHAYGSCASMIDAQAVFDELFEPDIVSWNACISGHAGEGNPIGSLHMFENFIVAGVKPDKITLTSVLSACSHTGLVVQGIDYFEIFSNNYGVTPNLNHYAIMLDLLARAGDFKRVENMLENMPLEANLPIWLCLLGACCTHGNVELAKHAFDHAVNLQPKQATAFVLMSNIHADAGWQECAAEVENARQEQDTWRKPGQSWKEHEQEVL